MPNLALSPASSAPFPRPVALSADGPLPTAQVVFERGPHGPAHNEKRGTAQLPYVTPLQGQQKDVYVQQKRDEYAPWLGADGTGVQR